VNNTEFDNGPEADVEALLNLIKQTALKEQAVRSAASPEPERTIRNRPDLAPRIDFITRAKSLAGAVDRIPFKARRLLWLERVVKKSLKWLVHWNTRSQAEFNEAVAGALQDLVQRFDTLRRDFASLEQRLEHGAEFQASLLDRVKRSEAESELVARALESATLNLYWSELEARLNQDLERFKKEVLSMRGEGYPNSGLQQDHQDVTQLLDELRMRLLRMERASGQSDRRGPDNAGLQIDVSRVDDSPNRKEGSDFDYFMFQHQYRGTVSEIKQRHSIYLDLFRDRMSVVDIGCGRGEFLELLADNGIKATGIDNSEDMVDFCRDRGLSVVHADMFAYLESLPDAALDAVFCSQVVEHISFDQILRLVSLCGEKIQPSGVLVVETVNTKCPEALSNFFLDPTHVRPVPAEMLRFVLEQGPFKVEALRFSSPVPGYAGVEVLEILEPLTREAAHYQDYAAIAKRC
jgi:O-antigen chain-terminating methyltransferase